MLHSRETSELLTVVVIGTRHLKSLISIKPPSQNVITLSGYEYAAWSLFLISFSYGFRYLIFLKHIYGGEVHAGKIVPKENFFQIYHNFNIIKIIYEHSREEIGRAHV